MKRNLYFTFLFSILTTLSFSQAPSAINYQAVVRDVNNQILVNQTVGIRFVVRQGSSVGTAFYTETFNTPTNGYGLINLKIGTGITTGNFNSIDWSNGPYYLETSIDETGGTSYTVLGTSQFLSVPYALHAETSENVINDSVDDADADPMNEIQDITLIGTDLSISNGSTIDLSSLQDGTGTDNQNINGSGLTGTTLTIGIEDGASETIDLSSLQDGTGTDDQNISGSGLTGNTLTIAIEGGASETIDLSSLDTDSTNEIQDITLIGTDLSISNGSTIDLSSLQDGTGTDNQNINGSGLAGTTLTIGIEDGASETIDLSSLQDGTGTDNQNINGSGLTGTTLTIGIEDGASETIDLSSLDTDSQLSEAQVDGFVSNNGYITSPNDADSDSTNEIQDIILVGTDLSISNGSTVDLSSLQGSTGTDDQNISGSGLTGNMLTIGIEGGSSEIIDLSSLDTDTQLNEAQVDGFVSNNGYITSPNDADSDSTNEIQTLSISGNNLSLSNGGSVTLPSSTIWNQSGTDINYSLGNVGIGTSVPSFDLQIDGSLGVEEFIYHSDESDNNSYFGFPAFNQFLLHLDGNDIIKSDGNIEMIPSQIRMENIPSTPLANDDKIVVANTSGYLKTVDFASLVEDEVIEVTNANHTSVNITENDIVRITGEIILSSNTFIFDEKGLHISGGKITGSNYQTIDLQKNSVFEGVIFDSVQLHGFGPIQFIACTFDYVTDFGNEFIFQNCVFNNCSTTPLGGVIQSLVSSEINNCTFLKVNFISNCIIDNSDLGNTNYSISDISNSNINNSKTYVNSQLTGNHCENSSFIVQGGNYGVSIVGNTFDRRLNGEDNILLLDIVPSGTTMITVNDNTFMATSSLPQSIKIQGTYSGISSVGLVGISGNIFSRGLKAITHTSNIRTTINNNASTGTTNFGVVQSLPNLIVRDNDIF